MSIDCTYLFRVNKLKYALKGKVGEPRKTGKLGEPRKTGWMKETLLQNEKR